MKRLITTRHAYYLWSKNSIISDDCYKHFRNHVTYQLKVAKRDYFHNLLENAKNDMRKVWNILNGLIRPQSNSNDRNIDSLIINDQTMYDNYGICDELNRHFSTIGSRISEEFGSITHNIMSPNQIENSLFFRDVRPTEISSIIENIENKYFTNIQQISNKYWSK